jgi:hypothetical protein
MTNDLNLSIENAENKPLTVEGGYALLVTLPADASKRFLSITPRRLDGTPIEADVEVRWSSNAIDVAGQRLPITMGSKSNRIELQTAGTATLQVTVGEGTKAQQSASLTIVVAPGVVMFGPDGRYYHLEASAWQATPLADDKVAEPVRILLERGAVLFTSAALVAPSAFVTCYVINLASMSNHLVAGPQLPLVTKR